MNLNKTKIDHQAVFDISQKVNLNFLGEENRYNSVDCIRLGTIRQVKIGSEKYQFYLA